jgi:hypothetical protein
MRLFIATVAVGLLSLLGVSSALADTNVGSQNETFTVRAAAWSYGLDGDPNVAYNLNAVRLLATVKNNSAEPQWAHIYLSSNFPRGGEYDELHLLQPGETWVWAKRFRVWGKTLTTGTYSITVSAYGGGDVVWPSEATASIKIVRSRFMRDEPEDVVLMDDDGSFA